MKKLLFILLLLGLPFGVQASQIEPDLMLDPYAGTSNDFGTRTEVVSDISGDGVNDLIVNTPSYNDSEGRIDIFFGQSAELLNQTPDVTITGGAADEDFGDWFTTFPDVTGDSLPELVVRANYGTVLDDTLTTNTNTGVIYFFASEILTQATSQAVAAIDIASAVIVGNNSNEAIGYQLQVYQTTDQVYLLSSTPDTNDGRGSVYVLNQTTVTNLFTNAVQDTIDNQANLEIIGETAGDQFTIELFAWDQAGYIVVGANLYGAVAGRAYFIAETMFTNYTSQGNSVGVLDASNAYITSSTSVDYFGTDISDAGPAEFDNDRYIAITSLDEVYLFSQSLIETITNAGSSGTAQTDATIVFTGEGSASDALGRDIRNINDQYLAISNQDDNDFAGVVYLFRNNTLHALADDDDALNQSAPTTADFIVYGDTASQYSGSDLAELEEDIDEDGINELIIGAQGKNQLDEEVAGEILVLPSSIWWNNASQQTMSVSDEALHTYNGDFTDARYDWFLHGSADLDNNGDKEIIGSAIDLETDQGHLNIFYNLEDLVGTFEHTLTLGQTNGRFANQSVEERANAFSDVQTNRINNTDGSMLVTSGDVDNDGDTETITTIQSDNRCHTIYIYSGTEKDKQFRACHPNREQTTAYISADTYASGSGQAYITVAFPNETHGAYLQMYKRQTNGSYKKVHRKRIETNVDFSQGMSLSSGNFTNANSAQIVLAANSTPTFYVYKLSNEGKIKKVTEKQVGSTANSLHLAVDGSNQMLYVSKWGKKRLKAYTWNGSQIVKVASNAFTVAVEPYGLAAEGDVVAVLNKHRKKLRFYYQGELEATKTYSKKIWFLDLVNQ